MDTVIKMLCLVTALAMAWKPRRIFYSAWNISRDSYASARAGLYVLYTLSLLGFVSTCIIADEPFSLFYEDATKTLLPSALMSLLTVSFVTLTCMIDANYRASRRQKFERNFFKHWLFQGISLFPILVCLISNRILMLVVAIIYLSGIFYYPKPQNA
ncbi:hypothetical protein [Telluria beijingensis]|uniref:hypothetical protein n=1 Tax=Telluria beijingensis TaxID=3068633 RepID=UPI002795281B|nr:hypothetical protein [Massilia sp. REN29]